MAGAPVTWSSRRQTTVALSTVEAEYVALSRCAQQMIWMQNWLDEVEIDLSPVSVVWSSILRVREQQRPSFLFKVSMTRWFGIHFSQLGFCLREGAGGSALGGMTGGSSTGSSISGILSTCKIENRLWADNEGVQVTGRLAENPP